MRSVLVPELSASEGSTESGSAGCAAVPSVTSDAGDGSASARIHRLKRLIRDHHDLVWRTLRRLGVPDRDVEDGVQRTFLIVGNKIDQIGVDQERSFVFGVAMRVASDVRRTQRRRPEELVAEHADETDQRPSPEALLDQEEMLSLLGVLLRKLPEEQRAVLLLHDLEQMSLSEIATMLDIPAGTAASRLRRGRLAFERLVSEWRKLNEPEDP
ncbi:MAG TPA: sigma-70 family RNA polymerase sigma factor [Polyangiaceae bacterium]|nr:sigma-70 family RNA polymerase sigma factor [Polyangiaceae bacterium]